MLLVSAFHADATHYAVEGGALVVTLNDGHAQLKDPAQFVGYRGAAQSPSAILLKHNGLHLEIQIDADDPIGKTGRAHVKDVVPDLAVACRERIARSFK